jgi:hypothetical protein
LPCRIAGDHRSLEEAARIGLRRQHSAELRALLGITSARIIEERIPIRANALFQGGKEDGFQG